VTTIAARISMFRRLVIILSIGAVALVWGWLDGPAARQERGIQAAEARKLQLQPRLAADPRFAAVDMSVRTSPELVVYGTVGDEQALRDLKSIVVIPPDANYRLNMQVKVDKGAATKPGG
jgi:hypothetical protein